MITAHVSTNCKYCGDLVEWEEDREGETVIKNGAADAWYDHFITSCDYNWLVANIMNAVDRRITNAIRQHNYSHYEP